MSFGLTDAAGTPIAGPLAIGLGCAVTASFDGTPVCARYLARKRRFRARSAPARAGRREPLALAQRCFSSS